MLTIVCPFCGNEDGSRMVYVPPKSIRCPKCNKLIRKEEWLVKEKSK